jgi:hypothetical protein
MTIGAAVILVIVVIAVLAMAGQVLGPKNPAVPETPSATPVPSAIPVTTMPVLAETTAAPVMVTETAEPVAVPTPAAIPESGIWLYIDSPSWYVGDIKAQGWTNAINTTGTYLIQIAAQNTLIEGMVEKTDGSGNPMEVKIYNGGQPIFSASTTKPFGMIEIRQDVGAPIIQNPVVSTPPTPVPQVVPTPDTALALKPVPASGTFVRVSYNGAFSGTITANGLQRRVSSSGDQFFQVSAVSGEQVNGVIEKPDGSDRILVVQVYRDGMLIDTLSSAKPYGEVEFHTVV